MKSKTPFFLIILVIILLDSHLLFNSTWSSASEQHLVLTKLEAFYYQKDFQTFHDSLQVLSGRLHWKVSPELLFKFAYSAYRTGAYRQAAQVFRQLADEKYLLPYSNFFHIKSLWQVDSLQARTLSLRFLQIFPQSPLADSLVIPLARFYFAHQQYDSARMFYQKAARLSKAVSQKVHFRIMAAHCLYRSGATDAALKAYRAIIKKYAAHHETEALVDWLENALPDWYRENFLRIYAVLRANRRLDEARVKLEQYIKYHPSDTSAVRKARFLLLSNYYYQGRYRSALLGFGQLYRAAKDRKLKAQCLLYQARIRLAMGQRKQSIQTYLKFARLFPENAMAPEVVWKSALLYETDGKLAKALQLYRKLYERWPHSDVGKEAYFRQGYALFRLGHYKAAEIIFNRIRFNRSWPELHQHRAQYWASLCREMIGDSLTARRLRRDIGKKMWNDYYTLKSYLLEKAYLDSTLDLVKELRSVRNPLHYYGKGFKAHLNKFERAFLLNDLLGADFARLELAAIKIDPNNLQEWIALAEGYKRLQLFGQAYKTYTHINRRFFRNLSYGQKFFILKERFPFYYDPIITRYCKRYGLERELVFGLIKQESAFDARAHSYANAYGLMQLIPPTARDMAHLAQIKHFSLHQLFDPEVNIHLGTLYLKQLQRLYHGDKLRMLAAYNAGPHRVKRWDRMAFADNDDFWVENIAYEQTRNYVRHVIKNYWAYKLLYNNFQIDQQKLLSAEQNLAEKTLLFVWASAGNNR